MSPNPGEPGTTSGKAETTTKSTRQKYSNRADDRNHEQIPESDPNSEINNLKSESIIFNYSSLELTYLMKNLLNRGLNFSVLPLKLDITQVLVDFNRFERSVLWQEFWAGREKDESYANPIFKTKKSNLPQNHTTPQGLKTFLGCIKSEIMDHKNRQQIQSNLPPDEIQAVKELIRLQRDRVIVIKACDKGAGLILLNFKDYMNACYEHLLSRIETKNNQPQYYYKQVDCLFLEKAKINIEDVLIEAHSLDFLTKNEYNIMNPRDCEPA